MASWGPASEADFAPAPGVRVALSWPYAVRADRARVEDLRPTQREIAKGVVLLDATPLEDIHNTMRIYAVVLDGRMLVAKIWTGFWRM